ncbi:ROK family protein [Bosea rubneri]|uniref:ROK family protein n=1 Tax=Bosea rubneri TaxID=3075434 RepID=A0ABU3SAN1_9HYPH|nr:ROK family protein [Bosea sp. ZW T0_25]MDU0341851.1 ROK family protein [Bosea sp. ZW T0_25]
MAKNAKSKPGDGPHGAPQLPSVLVTSYNLEARDEDGFVGDKARRAAIFEHLEDVREALRENGDDPLELPSEDLKKKDLDALLAEGSPQEAAVVHTAVERYAESLATVVRRFCRCKAWSQIERVIVGGGFRQSRVGELAIARAGIILRTQSQAIELQPIRHHPDEAGLIGNAHIAPKWMFEAFDSLVAVDIGGSNIRAGIVELRQAKASDLSKAKVFEFELWRHADETTDRDRAVERMGEMIRSQIKAAERAGLRVAPFIGIGCPGIIQPDGTIDRGAQNLPGNWESSRFNLIDSVRETVPMIGKHETMVTMHNDAVIQGLSEMPFMQDVQHWGVLTIGTGLGNASFENRVQGKKSA